jgi:O-antigen ligase
MATQAAGRNSLSLREANSSARSAAERREKTPGRGLAFLLGWAGAIASAGLVSGAPRPISIVGVVALAGAILLFPAIGTIIFFALAWANAPVVLTRETGNALLFGAASGALLCVPAFIQIFVLKRGFVLDRTFGLMMLFLTTLFVSLFVAYDSQLALAWIGTYVSEGILLYLLVVNAVRDENVLRWVIWTLVGVAALLCVFSIYQEVTRDYEHTFGGFAGRTLEVELQQETYESGGLVRTRESVRPEDRACGPVNDANYFAQILLVVLPMATVLIKISTTKTAKITALVLTLLVLSGILLTYSRGGFLILVVLALLMIRYGYFRLRHIFLGAIPVLAIIFAVAPGYFTRMDSLRGVSNMESVNDAALRGRLTEMLAAWNVFLDHPFVGVGPGQYEPYYSLEYMDDPGVAFRQIDKERPAHILYFELAAETGILGLLIFAAITLTVLGKIRRVRRDCNHRPDIVHLANGIELGILTYLGTGIFLSFAFMRYWWLLLAMAGALVTVAELYARDPKEVEEDALEEGQLREAVT